jgi:GNAT superfamily N-acetyltransferase
VTAIVTIRELVADDLRAAVDVIALGMLDNPAHIRAFGPDPGRRGDRLRRMFRLVLPRILTNGTLIGAFDGPTLVGVAGIVPPGGCQPSSSEMVALLPRLLPAVGPVSFWRLTRWIGAWAAHDPREPHVHLGPVAVDRHLQGQRIGSSLMREYCARLDRSGAVGYLETDKAQNVTFCRKFGFVTIAEVPVLAIPNWFMRRPGRAGGSAPPSDASRASDAC